MVSVLLITKHDDSKKADCLLQPSQSSAFHLGTKKALVVYAACMRTTKVFVVFFKSITNLFSHEQPKRSIPSQSPSFVPTCLVLVHIFHLNSVYFRDFLQKRQLYPVAVPVKTTATFTMKSQRMGWMEHYATLTYFWEEKNKK